MASSVKVFPNSGTAQPKRNKRESFSIMVRKSRLNSIFATETKFSHGCCRRVIVLANVLTVLFGLLFTALGSLVISNAPENPPLSAILTVCVGLVLMVMSAVTVAAGVKVKEELKRKKQLEEWNSVLLTATWGQRTLNSYFFFALLLVPALVLLGVWMLSSTEFVVAVVQQRCATFNSDGTNVASGQLGGWCEALDAEQVYTVLQSIAGMCLFTAFLQLLAAIGAVRIVTLFSVLQSLLQIINFFFVLCGYAIAFAGVWAWQLNGLQGGDGFPPEVYYVIIAVGGSLTLMALVGYCAAHKEVSALFDFTTPSNPNLTTFPSPQCPIRIH